MRTFVTPFDPLTIREALLREHYRGGQSFYVAPRIADLRDAERFLKETVRMAYEVDEIDSGCCGMAGSFGYEKEHYDVSLAIGGRRLFPAVEKNPEAIIVAPGISCRQQIEHATGRSPARYVTVKEEGPDHRKMFTIEAHVSASPLGNDGFVCRSQGSTKKAAEQAAARLAWERLQSTESAEAAASAPVAAKSPEQS